MAATSAGTHRSLQPRPPNVGPAPRRPRGRRLRELAAATPYLAAKLAIFGVFMLFPFGYTVYLTLQRGSMLSGLSFAGLENYRTILGDGLFLHALWNTVLFMLVLIPMTLVVTLAIGLLLSASIRGMGVYRALIYLPSLLSIVVAGVVWKMLIDGETGPLQSFTSKVLHLHVDWLTNGTTAIVFLSVVTLWTSLGFYSLIFMSAFNNVDQELLDAGRVDGAGAWRLLFSIRLPLIRPVIQLVLVLVTINAVQLFDLIYVMTQGGPGTATYTAMWYVYQNVFNGGSVPYAATMSLVLLLITAIITAAFLSRRRDRESANGLA